MRCAARGGIALAVILGASTSLAQTTYHVDVTNWPGPGIGTPAEPFFSIQTAIDATTPGDTVLVAPGIYVENISLFGKNITLRSSDGAEVTTIRGNRRSRVVVLGNDGASTTILDGFTITNGSGGIRVGGGSTLITNCRIVGNGGKADGGGMHINNGANATITHCVFHQNVAHDERNKGGGIFIRDSSATVSDCIFSENHACCGGGIYTDRSSSTDDLTVIDTLFENNTVRLVGAGVGLTWRGTTTLRNSIFRGNHAPSRGGALFYARGHMDAFNCAMINNSAVEAVPPHDAVFNGVVAWVPSAVEAGCSVGGRIAGNRAVYEVGR